MDPLLLDYYNQELGYFRELSGEFATAHPKIARRLGMQGMDVADPFVERLIESFCFLSARTRIRLDAEFPRFTQRLLEVVYPNYVSPTPSMAVVRLEPSLAEGSLADGFVVPRGTLFRTRIPHGQQTACQFRSGMDVTLWPFELQQAVLSSGIPDFASRVSLSSDDRNVQNVLRLRLVTTGGLSFSSFAGLDRLPLYLAGDEPGATRLFELLLCGCAGLVLADPEHPEQAVRIDSVLEAEGLEPEQGLLPLPWNGFHGYNLVHEYCACPSRFLFLALCGLREGLSRMQGSAVDIFILLNRPAHGMSAQVDASRFALFCTPVINLFSMRTDRIEVHPGATEFHLVPDRTRPLDFEVFSVSQVEGLRLGGSESISFRSLYETIHSDGGNFGRYFSVRRERRLLSERTRARGAQSGHIGTDRKSVV